MKQQPRIGPRRLAEPLGDAEVLAHRAFDCPAYEHCLRQACDRLWRSFTCVGCPGLSQQEAA